MSGKSCNGSFSFIMSAEWDYVGRRSRKRFLEDKYSISIAERLSFIRAVDIWRRLV